MIIDLRDAPCTTDTIVVREPRHIAVAMGTHQGFEDEGGIFVGASHGEA